MQQAIETWLERHADGTPFPAMIALRELAIEAICRNVMGLAPGPETATMTRDYGLLLAGLAATVPVRIPGTTYGRAMTARDRLLARIRTVVEERRARPEADGLSRILSATAPDGRRLHRRRGGARGAPHRGGGVRGVRAHGRSGQAPRHGARCPTRAMR